LVGWLLGSCHRDEEGKPNYLLLAPPDWKNAQAAVTDIQAPRKLNLLHQVGK
jgi:hypothetical protein